MDCERIVACVNACAGMDDPEAEIARLRGIDESVASMTVEMSKDFLTMAERAKKAEEAIAGIPHPEKLPELMAAVKEHIDAHAEYNGLCSKSTPCKDFGPVIDRIAEATRGLAKAHRAVMGERRREGLGCG